LKLHYIGDVINVVLVVVREPELKFLDFDFDFLNVYVKVVGLEVEETNQLFLIRIFDWSNYIS
jgi:hypothetical protein